MAIPCGLILNELISNCLKHAFPRDTEDRSRADIVKIALGETEKDYFLSVSDNGFGMLNIVNYRRVKTLGFQLVNSLTEQLGGTVSCRGSDGTDVAITFPKNKS